jgi:hypothetical protein
VFDPPSQRERKPSVPHPARQIGRRPVRCLRTMLGLLTPACRASYCPFCAALKLPTAPRSQTRPQRPLTFGFGPHKMHHCHDCDDDDDKEDDDKEDDDKDDDKKDKKKKKKKDDKKKKKKDKKKKDKKKKKKKDDDKKKDDSKDNSKDGKGVTVKVQNNLVNEDVEASGSDD